MPNATDSLYASFISAAGCSSTPTLACLRAASAQTLLTASETASDASNLVYPYTRAIDGYFHDRPPSESVSSGRVAIVPLLSGAFLPCDGRESEQFVMTVSWWLILTTISCRKRAG